jgi:hypothetical protein
MRWVKTASDRLEREKRSRRCDPAERQPPSSLSSASNAARALPDLAPESISTAWPMVAGDQRGLARARACNQTLGTKRRVGRRPPSDPAKHLRVANLKVRR